MLRISKQIDYGILLLAQCTNGAGPGVHNARDLSTATGLPLPMVSKVLKNLARGGILESLRGVKGGYILARPPAEITVAAIVRALEGPIRLVDCDSEDPEPCRLHDRCQVVSPMRSLAVAVRELLEHVTLEELIKASTPAPPPEE